MEKKSTFTFYNIQHMGFYKKDSKIREFATIEEILDSYIKWRQPDTKTIQATQTYAPQGGSLLAAYNYKVDKREKDYFVIMWNQSETSGGNLASLEGNKITTAASVKTSAPPPNYIPGFPTYFWIIPEKNFLCSIKFPGTHEGISQFTEHLECYLEKSSPWCRFKKPKDGETEQVLKGYKENKESKLSYEFKPKIRFKKMIKDGDINYIISNRLFIQKIENKDHFRVDNAESSNLLINMLSKLGIEKKRIKTFKQTTYSFSLPYLPSEKELSRIIEKWNNETDHARFDGIDFHFKDGTKRSIKSLIVREEVTLKNLKLINTILIDFESFMDEIVRRRDYLLKIPLIKQQVKAS